MSERRKTPDNERRIRELMAEGYREMADENRRLAEEAFPMVVEMILGTTTWDEKGESKIE
ncbi:MAG: hypothetical protein L0177_09860 [Chloroflexi bacterium]|nr:hypothetical protein [Chloroflexota bacterium]